jgi:ribosomal protein L11 methyltransferase
MPWVALSVRVQGMEAEALSEALLEQGAQSVCIEEPGLTALLAEDTDPCAVLAASGAAALPFTVSRVEDQDWVARSREQFAPIAIGRRLWVGPSWHEPPAGAATIVRLDPGMAFGTGSHPSTRLVLRFLERAVQGGERVLDYGCGSGILAIAAAKLGAGQVDAVDIDPQALEATAANARANGASVRVATPEALPAARYELVVANILAQPLMVLAPLLAARTAPGGAIALSGLLESQAAEVAAAYAGHFELVTRLEEGWAALEGRRR